ncbi:MAG: nitrogenase molybdenum-iron protein alpha chain, partial [Sulfurospirillaceae bacterium]|nr:nitrogenase molybdenum-iron protein alpha chain [Sulfurospirillaceae bacterium]
MTTQTLQSQQQAAIEEILEAYPEKAKKSRAKHLGVDAPEGVKGACDATKSNKQTVPGVMSQRGCAYAGSKGVVWGPVKDMIHISHGPIGCGQYSRAGRRNYYIGTTGVDTYVTMNFSTDYNEKDIVFGGDKKLKAALAEIDELFPLNNGISIQSECPIGLIGDDIQAVAKGYKKESGKPTVAVSCEGFRGVSQSLGHHIANDMIRDEVLPDNSYKKDFESTPYDVAIIGDYNIGGDAWSSRILLEEMGLRVIAQWSGDTTYKELTMAPKAKLNLLHCYRSMNYVVRHMEQEFGVPWIEYNFFGPSKTTESLRKIAACFDESIQAKTEAVIAKYTAMTDKVIAKYRPKLEGKTVMLYVGGLRPRHVIGAYEDLGMVIIGTGYEFGHGDDYKRTKDELVGTTLIYDDVNEYELEKFVQKLKPDLVASGVKEKYVFQKMGLPFRQMHSWDYSGPYHGYDAFAIFSKDMDLAMNSPVWTHTKAPWES